MNIMGEEYKLLGWYKENNSASFIVLKEGNIKPHLLINRGDKYKLFGPLGNSLPAEEIELQDVVDKLEKEVISNV
jgi:hypothetical protein